MAEGHNNSFSMNGYLEYEIYAGLQSSSVTCHGFKELNFADGGKIRWNQNNDYISGIFIGALVHQLTGTVTFRDEANDLTAYYKYAGYTFSKQDFVWGEVH